MTMLALAFGEIDGDAFAEWIRKKAAPALGLSARAFPLRAACAKRGRPRHPSTRVSLPPMLDPRWIRDNAAAFDEGRRNARAGAAVGRDDRAGRPAARDGGGGRSSVQERRNAASSQAVGAAMKAKRPGTKCRCV